MSRRPARWIGISTLWFASHIAIVPLVAQDAQPDEAQEPDAPVREPIDIEPIERSNKVELPIVTTRDSVDARRVEECEEDQDAATISGEIVVCRTITEDNSNYYSGSRENARKRYAKETQYADVLLTPDVAGPGIFKGPATVGSLCIPGLQKCPPPPALIIDVAALPQAPAGSDADRIARGLPPLGNDEGPVIEEKQIEGSINPEESEEPAEPQ